MKKFRIFMILLSIIYLIYGIWVYIEVTDACALSKCRLAESAMIIFYFIYLIIGLSIWGLVETTYFLGKKQK